MAILRATSNPGKVAVLDRDGTVVVDRGYLSDPDGLEFLPYAVEGLRLLQTSGYRMVVATNQSGVGRGYFPPAAVDAMNARLQAMFAEIGVPLAGIYVCPHAPEDGCDCRKPALGLMTRAAAELGFDPRLCVVIGDKLSDVEFGRRAGARTVLISSDAKLSAAIVGHATVGQAIVPHAVARNLLEAARASSAGPA
jgi:D-glycero-D-manno-heptose 1,7-bisphosphate phosphatase